MDWSCALVFDALVCCGLRSVSWSGKSRLYCLTTRTIARIAEPKPARKKTMVSHGPVESFPSSHLPTQYPTARDRTISNPSEEACVADCHADRFPSKADGPVTQAEEPSQHFTCLSPRPPQGPRRVAKNACDYLWLEMAKYRTDGLRARLQIHAVVRLRFAPALSAIQAALARFARAAHQSPSTGPSSVRTPRLADFLPFGGRGYPRCLGQRS